MSVFFHEYGHCVLSSLVPDAFGGSGMKEGNADVLSNVMLLESEIARGWAWDCNGVVRDSRNHDVFDPSWPWYVDSCPIYPCREYPNGSALAGFFWDAMEQLMEKYGVADGRRLAAERWLFALADHHNLIHQPLEQVYWTIAEDDDDGDLTNGTPNFSIYKLAANNHGFDKSLPRIHYGACCHYDGTCSYTAALDCPAADIWQGADTDCQTTSCPSPEPKWRPLADGFGNGSVRALTGWEGSLIAGGSFTTADSIEVGHVAGYDGEVWSRLGWGTDGTVLALTTFDGNLIAGGSFVNADSTAASHIAQWDGTSWTPLGDGLNGNVRALVVYGGDLVAGGDFTQSGQTSVNHVAIWDGSYWSPVGSGVNGPVHALATQYDALLAGGEFTAAGGDSAQHIARWDGINWSRIGAGADSVVRALAAGNDALFAGGDFHTAGGVTVNHVARWENGVWAAMDTLGSQDTGTNGPVFALSIDGASVLVGGGFTATGTQADHVARWWQGRTQHSDGTWTKDYHWSPAGLGMNGDVLALGFFSEATELIAAGEFTVADTMAALRIAEWLEYPTAVEELPKPPTGLKLTAFPNPGVGSKILVSYELPTQGAVDLEVFSASGRRVRGLLRGNQHRTSGLLVWDGTDDRGRRLPLSPPPNVHLGGGCTSRCLPKADDVAVRVFHRRNQRSPADILDLLQHLRTRIDQGLQALPDVVQVVVAGHSRLVAIGVQPDFLISDPEADVVSGVRIGFDSQQRTVKPLRRSDVLDGIYDGPDPLIHDEVLSGRFIPIPSRMEPEP